MLMSLAGGKVAVCLEGGYDLKAISRSALAVAKTLMGEPPERMVLPPVSRDAALVLAKVKQIQAPYWECMRSGQVQTNQYDATAVRLNEVIRTYQRRTLSEKHKMVSLYVQRNQLFRTFEGQILATQSLHAARRILLIIHDP
jgi:histone deacetylase 6